MLHSFSVSKTILLLSSCSLTPAYDRHSAPGKMGRRIFLSAAAPHSKLLANSVTHHIISIIDECVPLIPRDLTSAIAILEFSGDGVKDNNQEVSRMLSHACMHAMELSRTFYYVT